VAFDLLELDGKDLRGRPLNERRWQLQWLMRDAPEVLWYSSDVEGKDGPVLFRHACDKGAEGIVAKRRDMPYRSGPRLDSIQPSIGARNASRAAHRRRQDSELRRFRVGGRARCQRHRGDAGVTPCGRGQCRVAGHHPGAGHPTMRRRSSAERRAAIYRASVEPCCGAVADPFVDGGSRLFPPNNPRSSLLRLSREIALYS
jgi:hypothetical protein